MHVGRSKRVRPMARLADELDARKADDEGQLAVAALRATQRLPSAIVFSAKRHQHLTVPRQLYEAVRAGCATSRDARKGGGRSTAPFADPEIQTASKHDNSNEVEKSPGDLDREAAKGGRKMQ